jgi:hypothetical protein
MTETDRWREINVGYAEFLRLFQVDDPLNWQPGLIVRRGGVFIAPVPDDLVLPADVRAELSLHPDGNPDNPVITFPTTLGEIHSRLYRLLGMDTIDQFELAAFISKSERTREPRLDPLGSRERNNLLRIIAALAIHSNIPLEKRKGGAEAIVGIIDQSPYGGPREDTMEKVLAAIRELDQP